MPLRCKESNLSPDFWTVQWTSSNNLETPIPYLSSFSHNSQLREAATTVIAPQCTLPPPLHAQPSLVHLLHLWQLHSSPHPNPWMSPTATPTSPSMPHLDHLPIFGSFCHGILHRHPPPTLTRLRQAITMTHHLCPTQQPSSTLWSTLSSPPCCPRARYHR